MGADSCSRPEKREYELVYHGKEREEDILANTLAVPLQPVRTFGRTSKEPDQDWQNMLIFGDNLQVMKTLLRNEERPASSAMLTALPACGSIYIDPPFATRQEFRGSRRAKGIPGQDCWSTV